MDYVHCLVKFLLTNVTQYEEMLMLFFQAMLAKAHNKNKSMHTYDVIYVHQFGDINQWNTTLTKACTHNSWRVGIDGVK